MESVLTKEEIQGKTRKGKGNNGRVHASKYKNE